MAEVIKREPARVVQPGASNTYIDKVRRDRRLPMKVEDELHLPKIIVKEVDPGLKSFRCCMCGTTYTKQQGNFANGGTSPLWKGNNGYTPFCRKCVETLFGAYTNFYGGNEEHALRHICGMFDWYYNELASAMSLAQVLKDCSRISIYFAKASTRQVTDKGRSFLDTIRDEQRERERLDVTLDGVRTEDDGEEEEEEFVVTKAMMRSWGNGYTRDQYEYLEREYADWNERTEVKTKSQEELIRAICIAQLNVRIAQRAGGKVDAAMKTLQDLMTSCNLTPRQKVETSALNDMQLSYGQLIKKIEDEDPIPEPLEEFKDPDGIRRYMTAWFLGPMSKALGIRNDQSAVYEEEMKKYSVDVDPGQTMLSADEILSGFANDPVGEADAVLDDKFAEDADESVGGTNDGGA